MSDEQRQEEALVEKGVPRALAHLADRTMPETDWPIALQQLRRPFTPAAVRWKVQTEFWEGSGDGPKKQGAVVVAYIDARLVIERLNLVWPWWDEDKQPAGQGAMRCVLRFNDPDTGEAITRKTDVGEGGDIKSMESDSLKRAAVHVGIGASIYALKSVKMYVGNAPAELRTELRRKKNRQTNQWEDKWVPTLDAASLAWLAEKYEAWLEARGERLFGPALDHGDEEDAQGIDTESPRAAEAASGGEAVAPAEEAETLTPMTDERSGELKLQAEGIFQQLRALKPRALAPARFQAKLLRALSTSHEALEALIQELEAARLEAEAEKAQSDA